MVETSSYPKTQSQQLSKFDGVVLVGIRRLNLNAVPGLGEERHMRRSVTHLDLDR
jgi:hypothetical protein